MSSMHKEIIRFALAIVAFILCVVLASDLGFLSFIIGVVAFVVVIVGVEIIIPKEKLEKKELAQVEERAKEAAARAEEKLEESARNFAASPTGKEILDDALNGYDYNFPELDEVPDNEIQSGKIVAEGISFHFGVEVSENELVVRKTKLPGSTGLGRGIYHYKFRDHGYAEQPDPEKRRILQYAFCRQLADGYRAHYPSASVNESSKHYYDQVDRISNRGVFNYEVTYVEPSFTVALTRQIVVPEDTAKAW